MPWYKTMFLFRIKYTLKILPQYIMEVKKLSHKSLNCFLNKIPFSNSQKRVPSSACVCPIRVCDLPVCLAARTRSSASWRREEACLETRLCRSKYSRNLDTSNFRPRSCTTIFFHVIITFINRFQVMTNQKYVRDLREREIESEIMRAREWEKQRVRELES